MFASLNFRSFGEALKQVRLNCNYTQLYVKKACGINTDTLRKLENGYVIPKYETLEILASVYKYDLISLLKVHSEDNVLVNIYSKLDQAIIKSNLDDIGHVISSFKDYLNESETVDIINKQMLHLLDTFLNESINYHDDDYHNYNDSIENLITALSESIDNFDISNIGEFRYNYLELRTLMFIGLFYVKNESIKLSNDILLFSVQYLIDQRTYSRESNELITKLQLNISYNYYRLNEYTKSLEKAEKTIKSAAEQNSLYCLPQLYFRKATAEFRLGIANYENSFKKGIMLFEVTGNEELAAIYKRITKEKYNVEI